MNPDDFDDDDLFFELTERAHLLVYELNRSEEALPLLHRALALDPTNAEVLMMLAITHLERGGRLLFTSQMRRCIADLLQGARYYRAAMRANPDSREAYLMQVMVFQLFRQRKRAVRAAQNALNYDPEDPILLETLGETLLACRRYAEAEDAVLEAREIDPERVEIPLLLAQIAQKQKQWDKAEAHYFDALELDAANGEALHGLGNVLWEQGRKTEAVERFADALRLNPTSFEYQRSHSKAVRRLLLPAWAGKLFARTLSLLVLFWTALLYGALCSLGWRGWIAGTVAFLWGNAVEYLSRTYPDCYIKEYRRNLEAADHSPAVALALQSGSCNVSLPDEAGCFTMLGVYCLWIALLSRFGAPLVDFWDAIGGVGPAPSKTMAWVSLGIFIWLMTANQFKPKSPDDEATEETPPPADDSWKGGYDI